VPTNRSTNQGYLMKIQSILVTAALGVLVPVTTFADNGFFLAASVGSAELSSVITWPSKVAITTSAISVRHSISKVRSLKSHSKPMASRSVALAACHWATALRYSPAPGRFSGTGTPTSTMSRKLRPRTPICIWALARGWHCPSGCH
jgi:hypothetical protein